MKTQLKKVIITLFISMFMAGATFINVNAATKTIDLGNTAKGTLDEQGVLTVTGTGEVSAAIPYSGDDEEFIKKDVYKLVIKEGITSIGKEAFSRCENLQSITFPSTLIMIGESSFCDCDGLYEINIPGNVKTIGTNAFGSSSLTKCTLNKGLETIGEKAFAWTDLTSIIIPEGVLSIEPFAFTSVKHVTISKNVGIIKANAFDSADTVKFESNNVVLGERCFVGGAEFTTDRGSTADVYARNYNNKYDGSDISIKYNSYPTTVYFNANGGTVTVTSKTYNTETAYGVLPKAKRKGYKFNGWYTKTVGGKKKKAGSIVASVKPTTLYAQWTKISVGKAKKPKLSDYWLGKMSVEIQELSGVKNYQIRYSLKKSMKGSKLKTTNKLTKVLTKLKKGKRYYVQIRGYMKDSTGKKIYGKWSNNVAA